MCRISGNGDEKKHRTRERARSLEVTETAGTQVQKNHRGDKEKTVGKLLQPPLNQCVLGRD